MGRDHTIYAAETGFVKYYRDPARHPKRRYIGVVFDRAQALPASPQAARRRRLGMYAVPRADADAATLDADVDALAATVPVPASTSTPAAVPATKDTRRLTREARRRASTGRLPTSQLAMRPDYSYRESNYDIGRAAERAGVDVPAYRPGDRFLAWRKTAARRARSAEKRALGGKKGAGGGKGKGKK